MATLEQQLVVHGQLAHLAAQSGQLLIMGVRGTAPQVGLPAGQEVIPPGRQAPGCHPKLSGDTVK
jgi:hypothetical protein